ncbi:MAG: M50 family metallopeptidase [Armatimonadetes bacterium]|nr:M50 family metallopeptidase [Armatimonadota bacterium]
MALRRDQTTLIYASIAALALWVVPVVRILALPLIYLNTHVHELCHAVTGLATGGQVEHILVFTDGSGVTPIFGGNVLLEASAGYVGSALVGGILIAMARDERGAKAALCTLFGFLAGSMLLFVRGDMVGVLSGIFWVPVLGLLAAKLRGHASTFAAQFLGVQLALTSLQSLLVLLKVTVSPEPRSDALILQQISGLPAVVWAAGWSVLGLFMIGASLAIAWRPARKGKRS